MRRTGDSVTDPPESIRGYVLVGGRSSRMGRNKALLPFGSVPLAVHVAATIKQTAGRVSFVGSPEIYNGLGFSVLPDLYPGYGPVGAIATVLSATDAPWNIVVACDLPGVTADVLRAVVNGTVASGSNCGVAAGPDGIQQPLCAVYHVAMRGAFDAAVQRGEHRLTHVVRELQPYVLHLKDVGPLRNVNTPEEWAAVNR